MKQSTRRKKEKLLLELLKKASDQSSDGIIITTAKVDKNNPKMLYVNNTFCNMTKYNEYEIIGKTPKMFNGSKTDPTLLLRLQKKLSKGYSCHEKNIIYRKDGSELYVEWDISPVFDKAGKLTNVFFIVRDVSQQIVVEERKEEVIGVLSHELKTPLTAIKGFVEILLKRFKEPRDIKSKEYLGIIEREVTRVITLTNELLGTTRTKINGIQPIKKKYDLDEVIRQVIKNVKITAGSHKISRRGKIGRLVNCDKDKITQVLTNLLTNAIKYSPDATQILLSVHKDDYFVTISIQDFGIGISVDQQGEIFNRFYRATGEKQAISYGLGLYVASEIVRNHGGKIWVESCEGKGSTFSFSLPLS